ncbi:serine threonine protein kinase CMGC group [Exophiala dermatitidis]|uniref:dual-specificity kinase n=2 Tax=Exophiala dermatitidis TaxID=5970 RepID=H6BZ23_EXODN|nr:dual-specificity kinase [Exophiala dermatitidis NIH/UT8656]KAJ4514317.1 serine threonine protein kinase CMGC group [Exophiala dermatitidis]EHY56886.1 dual-specificity kinase [Exophiala dermatitidis NIH/UT8656]KAJ4520074.1 serine threonine protein kinase CMGC group [Exophiala dermatitidis]KAJ4523916.1 serine threonine protein kinase CMGC group [Exophiala dermatitidis]KAJ4537142.1 serine threonine protein kinase CMGC group [Exophiala dermatitidis]
MSTPSIATTTIPAHHSQYGYGHQNPYSPSTRTYPATNAMPAPQRLTTSYHSYPATAQYPQPQQSPGSYRPPSNVSSMAPSQSASTLPDNQRRQPNWNEFYKNGIPKEIIVIDDDSPEPQSGTDNARPNPHPETSAYPSNAGRKRKVDQGYEIEYTDSPAYSTHPTKFGASSSSASYHSGDRTTSIQTVTAPTSLESYASNPASHSYEDVRVGQKRKRVQPAKETRAQAKRKQQETADAYADYVPPSKPLRKAADVHVPVIRDTLHKHQKVDDDDGHYIVTPHTPLTDRYDIVRLLGQGTFGKVVEAYDKRKKTKCAVKIIRSVQKYRDASRIELRVLSTLALNDKDNRNKCIHLRDSFDFRNHICIVTDLLGQSVFDFLKGNGFVPFPSSQIQSFARQLFTSVAFLHDLNLIHTDLKPENILLVHNAYQTFTYNRTIPSSSHTTARTARQRRVLLDSEIRLIDFGSATFDDEYHSSVVSTRHYRAPEIILQLGWSFPCDIWSIGCIIVEFFTGDALFQTHDNLEHLAMMEAVCNGKIDAKLVRAVCSGGRGANANPAAKFFNRGKLDYPNSETSKASRKYVKAMKHLHEFIPANTSFNRQLLDLLRKIFVYDPKQRITAKEALKHPWFKETLVDDGTEAIRIREERANATGVGPDAKRPRV